MMGGIPTDFMQKAVSDSANGAAPSENRFGYAAHVPQVAGLLAAGGAALVLIGWVFDIGPVKAPIPGLATMKANTAAVFVLAGAAVWMSKAGVRPSRGTCLLASVVAIVGLATLSEYLFGWDLHFDQLAFKDDKSPAATLAPGRMSPATASFFVLFGASVLVSAAERTCRFRDGFVLMMGFLGLVAIIGSLYNITALYGIWPYKPMAVHTAGLMVALAVGLLYSHPSGGMIEILLSGTLAGTSVRRLVPFAIATQAWQVPSGVAVGPCSQLTAFASKRANDVLPVPRGPAKR